MKALSILVFCFSIFFLPLAAQDDFTTRLLNAADEAAAARLLDQNPGAVNGDLFETCRKSAQAHLDKRENNEAVRQFEAALAVAKALNSDHGKAVALRGLGILDYRLDHASQAIAAYEEGIPAAVRSGDRSLEAEIYRGMGVARRNLGDFERAIEADARSVAIFRELGDTHQTAASLNNLGGNYRQTGDLRQATDIWEEGKRVGAAFADIMISANLNLALVAGQQGNAEASVEYLEQAAAGAGKGQDWHTVSVALANLGSAYRTLDQYDKALAAYKRALALAVEARDTRLQSAVLVNRSQTYIATGQRTLAIADLEASLKLHEGGESKDAYGETLGNLAPLELASGQLEKAFQHATAAAEVAGEFQSPEIEWEAYDALGQCWAAKKNRTEARKAFERSIAVIENLRLRAAASEEDGQHFLEGRIAPYQHLIQLDLEEGLNEHALSLAERARARQLLDVLRLGRTEPTAEMTAEEKAEERRLAMRLSQLDEQVAGAANANSRATLQKPLETAEREMDTFRMRLYMVHPKLAAQKGDAVPVTLAQTAELMPDAHTALIEFASTEDNLLVFTIMRGADGEPRLRTHTIHWPRPELNRAVDEFLAKLGARDLNYREPAEKIYARLLGPLAAELRDAKTLVLLPDGPLWNLPFQALIAPDGKYLIERQAIFYAPSLTYLREARRAESAAKPKALRVLAVGDPDTAGLPEAAREVRELSTLYGPANAKTLVGPDALKAAWEKEAPNYQILHIATHGILNARNPLYSYLLFSGKKASDQVLEAREVVNLKLDSSMVILSACETGRGKVSLGEGLVGMSWAFLLAGARTTVVSQWKTDSASTTKLMLGMHESLKPALASSQGFGRARSLQKAALTLMQTPEYRHPFYWAGFVMMGDGY